MTKFLRVRVPFRKKFFSPTLFNVFFMILGFGVTLEAKIAPNMIQNALLSKTNAYRDNGLFVGGDSGTEGVVVREIRHGRPKEYEALVIELWQNLSGELTPLNLPPYFHVALIPEEQKIQIAIWGHPTLQYNAKETLRQLKKSTLIEDIDLLPKVENELWTFSLRLKKAVWAEVFELSNPARITLHLKAKGK